MTDLAQANEPIRDDESAFDGFPCIELVDPDRATLEGVAARFGVHELAVEDAIHAHQRPKLERYGDTLLLVIKSTHYDDEAEAVEVGETLLLFNDRFVVIVRHDPALSLDLGTPRGPNFDDGPAPVVVVHRVIDQIVDGYAPVLDGFEADVREVEETVFSAEDIYPTERIYRLKRQLLLLLHNTRPLIEPLHQLSHADSSITGEGLNQYFRDVEDHLQRVTTRITRSSELVSEMLDANLAQVSLRQNEDMRKMSAWAAIVLVPTILAGIWGMNFEHMPELELLLGYPAALGVMAVGSALLYWRFRKSGWL